MESEAMARSVAVLGTGIMGSAMARNMAKAGAEVSAWNRHRERAAQLEADGIEVFEDAAEAIRERDAVLTMLPDAAVVRAVMSERVLGAIAHGAVWIQASTVGIAGTDELIALASRHGVRLLDAPVAGTKGPAEAGALVILASGDDTALDFCRPLLDAIASKTVWLGEAGNGTRMKLVANDWVLGVTALMAEALRLCERLELPPQSFIASLEGSPVGCVYARTKGEMMIAGEFEPNFPLQHGAKDTRLILDAAQRVGLALPIAAATAEHFAAALASGVGEQDVAAVYLETAR